VDFDQRVRTTLVMTGVRAERVEMHDVLPADWAT
jgi:hypothetical protein